MGLAQSLAVGSMDMEEYVAVARTGDLVLWSSRGSEATLVKIATGSYYSHIGIVLVMRPPLHPDESGVYLYHSPSDALTGLVDRFSNPPRSKAGPQLNDLRTALYVCRHAKSIEVRRLRCGADKASHPWATGVLDTRTSTTVAFARAEHTKMYEQSVWELWRSAYDGPGGMNTEDLSSYFCSELVAELLKRARVLDTDLPSNEFTPGDFSSRDVREAPLARGFAWDTEVKITYSPRVTGPPRRRGAGAGAGAGVGRGAYAAAWVSAAAVRDMPVITLGGTEHRTQFCARVPDGRPVAHSALPTGRTSAMSYLTLQ